MSGAQTIRRNPLPIAVAGGGIGGLASALALARHGQRVALFERADAFQEFGAGLQLGPNAIRLLRDWDVLDRLKPDLVAPDEVRLMDCISDEMIGHMPLGDAFEQRFGAPYYVAHRTDLHRALQSACTDHPDIELKTSTEVTGYAQDTDVVTVTLADDGQFVARGLVAADGIHSTLRRALLPDDPPAHAGHTAFRTLLAPEHMPPECSWNAATLWTGPDFHLVHYPISGGRKVNIVATIRNAWRGTGWNEAASKGELLDAFAPACATVKRVLEAGSDYRKWALADREPATHWSDGRVTLLGDAAHPVLPFMAQGAAMAIEDAWFLAASVASNGDNLNAAFQDYERRRLPRTARLQRQSRYLGGIYHARGTKRFFRNLIMRRQKPADWYRRVAWVYDGPDQRTAP